MAKCKQCGKGNLFTKTNSEGLCKECETAYLYEEIERLKSLLTPELLEVNEAIKELERINSEKNNAEQLKQSYLSDIEKLNSEIKQKQSEII